MQDVYLFSYFVYILTQNVKNEWVFFFILAAVWTRIHLCSVGKLFSSLVNILTQDVIKNEWLLFSPLLLYQLMDSLVLSL